MDRSKKLYSDLYDKYVKAHTPEKTKAVCQSEVNVKWKCLKSGLPKDITAYNDVMRELDEKIQKKEERMKRGQIMGFLNKQMAKSKETAGNAHEEESTSKKSIPDDSAEVEDSITDEAAKDLNQEMAESVVVAEENLNEASDPVTLDENDNVKRCPGQDKLKQEIEAKMMQIVRLEEAMNLGLSNDREIEKKKIKAVKEIQELKKKLKKLETDRKAMIKLRANRKEVEEKLKMDNPELAKALKLRDCVGRPRVECDQPLMGETLLRIAMIGSAASDKRRDEILRSVKTLDDLKKALHDMGFSVSRSALYLRLQPRNQTTLEGKRHVNTVPVKLTRPQNNLRKKHPDRMFAAETKKGVESLCQVLGPVACLYVSQDDKASVAIGKTAAKVQVPLLMNMRYRVRMPDHDFAVGSRHLLVPSVMAVCIMDPDSGQVTYSGPTLVRIRSSKHNNSSAFSHQEDLSR